MTQQADMRDNDAGRFVIGVDVGTGSVRAGVFDLTGALLGVTKRDIAIFRALGNMVEPSSPG
ncbi:D-ribulokinase [Ensifer adhaerens]|nr:D-ribulokinase [Ensifer adhaerens]